MRPTTIVRLIGLLTYLSVTALAVQSDSEPPHYAPDRKVDITYLDPETQGPRVLDGVFGFNLLCPTKRLPGMRPVTGSSTPFDKVVIDLSKPQVGLRLKQD